MSLDGDGEHLTLAEAARRLGMPPRTVDRWARAGHIPSTVTVTGLRTFCWGELLRQAASGIDEAGREQQ